MLMSFCLKLVFQKLLSLHPVTTCTFVNAWQQSTGTAQHLVTLCSLTGALPIHVSSYSLFTVFSPNSTDACTRVVGALLHIFN